MNRGKTMLCLDSNSLKYPHMIGLDGEDLISQDWLNTYCTAVDARNAFEGLDDQGNVWVVSCDDMEGINLAAALKHDNANGRIELVSFGGTGSEVGRCQAAGIGLIRGKTEFLKCYFERKASFAHADAAVKGCLGEFSGKADISSASPFEEEPLHYDRGFDDGRLDDADAGDSAETVSLDEPHVAGPLRSARATRPGFVVSVISGNGGVGKSTVSACLAALLQGLGIKTVLLDLDLQFGDVGFLLGADEVLSVDEAIAQPERVACLEPKDGLPAIIGAPAELEQSETVVDHIGDLIDLLRESFGVVVVNTGSFWSESHIRVIESSDKVLFVLDQRPSSVRACSRALDLCARCGIAVQPFCFVLNLCSKHALLTALDVSCALHGVHVAELKDGGREVGELLGAGLPMELMSSKNAFIESLKELLSVLLPEHLKAEANSCDAATGEKRPLFSAFRKRKSA